VLQFIDEGIGVLGLDGNLDHPVHVPASSFPPFRVIAE
jgi:hypothetical protein